MPLASFGMPVYNGEQFLAAALDSILAQTETDFEIVVSDNASTDRTPEILDRYGSRDSRIRVIRQDRNVGAVANFDVVLQAARGHYFGWTGDHDVYDPRWLETMIDALEEHPEAVLAYPWYRGISHEGERLYRYRQSFDTTGLDWRKRLTAVTEEMRAGGSRIYGCFRRAAMSRVRVHVCAWWDRLFLTEMAALGSFVQVERILWARRHADWEKVEDKRALAMETLAHQFRTVHPDGRVPFYCRVPSLWHVFCVLWDLSLAPPAARYSFEGLKVGPYAAMKHYRQVRDKIALEIDYLLGRDLPEGLVRERRARASEGRDSFWKTRS